MGIRRPTWIWLAALAGALVVAPLALGVALGGPGGAPRSPVAEHAAPTVPPTRPTRRAEPRYLTQSYRVPPALVSPGAGGSLQVPSIGVRAPVDAVGLDDGTMAVPDDPARVGWLRSSAGAGDVVGASVLAGHISDRQDRPGTLARLEDVRVGAVIVWTDRSGRARRFRVTGLQRFPRADGLPAGLFRTDGPHLLHLVTCADRRTTDDGWFHYAANLVVTARTEETGPGRTD